MPPLSSTQPPHATWLASPEVHRAIEGALLRRGVRGADLEDQRQTVLRVALEVERPPESKGECIRLVQTIATRSAISAYRKSRSRSKFEDDLCENPDVFGADATEAPGIIDARRQLEVIRRDVEAGTITHRQAAILAHAIDDVPQPEIAAQMNLAHQTVRNELATARRTARTSWAKVAAVAFCTVLGLFLWYTQREDQVSAPRPDAPVVPSQHEAPPSSAKLQAADELRRKALHECEEQHWDACIRGLDEARSLAGGEETPAAQKARDDATKHVRERSSAPDTPAKP